MLSQDENTVTKKLNITQYKYYKNLEKSTFKVKQWISILFMF